MENKKGGIFFFAIIAIIVGTALWKQIDFKTMTVDKIGLSILYLCTFLFAVFFLVRNLRNRNQN
ncbi:hypothetical protein OF897_09775 [Chryseobacterium formosus]|uniref:ATP synthase F0 sector subunit C n=1 Tax=Chryseobacterium formosus TaxID=1537363 RepID=A0ABT3XQ26_9FLAO|nr:hypothetical protein [Chryseobacterium formosus]MCX8524208.1 hypothetical protein [Chryseobacterium formosus]